MKKSWERTKQERAEDRKTQQLETLRSCLSRKYWTAGEAALYFIGVDSVEDHTDDQGYCLNFLPGTVDAEWLWHDGTHNQRHFDECFECNLKNAKNILAMVSDKKADSPINWISNYINSGEVIPWFGVAKKDKQCARFLNHAVGQSLVNKTVTAKGLFSPQQKGGREKARGSVSSFVRIEIEKLLTRWHLEPHLYPDCPSFKRDMKEKFIDDQASPDPDDFPDKTNVCVRSPSVVNRHIKELIDIHDIPKGMIK